MLSAKLINLIEAHQEQITANVIREIRHHPAITDLRKLPDAELREDSQEILEHLSHWLSAGHSADIDQRYEKWGELRFEESIPLYESVQALALLKEKMFDFVHYQVLARTSMDLYAEEELERRLGRFFDELTVHLVHGYETAWRRAAHVAA